MVRYDDALLEHLRGLDDRPFAASQLTMENDNNFFVAFVKHGALVKRRPPYPGEEESDRISGYIQTEGRLERRLATGRHTLCWENVEFQVEVAGSEEGSRETVRIHLGDDPEAVRAFCSFAAHIKEYARRKSFRDAGNVVVKTLRGTCWRTVSTYPKRTVQSLVTGDGAVEAMVADMRVFMEAQDEYRAFGFPYKRVYLVTGPPGSGKSSLVTIAASELDLDVCYLSIIPGQTEKDLTQAVSNLPDNGMLVIEDADGICAACAQGSNTAQTALTVLTSILDGTLHRERLVTVLTSANPAGLEDILTRPGRVDFVTRLAELNRRQVGLMVARVFPAGDERELKALGERIWAVVGGAQCEMTSSIVSHFLFKHRARAPVDITSELCGELLHGTKARHIADQKPARLDQLYM